MQTTPLLKAEAFDPTKDESGSFTGFPGMQGVTSVEQYADFFTNLGPAHFENWCEGQSTQIQSYKTQIKSNGELTPSVRKALALPPEMASFGRFSLMPETQNGGVIQWPGIPPEALRKVARENLAPQTIIGMRVDDILRYSVRSTRPWKPGWRITLREGFDVPDEKAKTDIEDAYNFIENCNIETQDARKRDRQGLQNFAGFLAELTRDTLTYDGMAVWTDMELSGKVKSFKTLSSFNIRLCGTTGYMGDKNIWCVGVDEAGNVIHQFTRDQLIWRHRNPRADADIYGYGYSEIEQAIKLIQGFQSAWDMNSSVFTRNSMPNGFLTAKGIGNQKQLDILSRIWMNLKRGVSKNWAIPVIPLPKDGEISVVDLNNLKDMDVYYQEFINMTAGLFCAIYRFPVHKLGYRTQGSGAETKPDVPPTMTPGIEDYDPYITVLLQHIAALVNEYIIWTRWPFLELRFTGSSPKEDAREYEATILSCTEDERRALNDQPKLETLSSGDAKLKEVLKIMGAAPVDPGLGGIYQSAVTAIYAKESEGEGGTKGASFTSKKDPARSEDHGHMSGVRRDSAEESK